MASEFSCTELENWQDTTTTTTTTPRVAMKEESLSRSRGQSFSSGGSPSAAVAKKVEKKNEPGERVPNYVRVLMVTDVNGRRKQLYIPAALDLERPKRPRTTFSESQLLALERQFEDSHFIGETKREKLAVELGLTETQIKVWFQNRRTKCRRLGECGKRSRSSTGSQDNFFSGPEESTTRDKFMLPMTKTGGGLHLPPFRASPLPLPTSTTTTTMNTTPWSPDFHPGFATTLLHHYEHTTIAFRPPQETWPNRYHKL